MEKRIRFIINIVYFALLLLLTALALWRRRPALRVPRGLAAAFVKKEWGIFGKNNGRQTIIYLL